MPAYPFRWSWAMPQGDGQHSRRPSVWEGPHVTETVDTGGGINCFCHVRSFPHGWTTAVLPIALRHRPRPTERVRGHTSSRSTRTTMSPRRPHVGFPQGYATEVPGAGRPGVVARVSPITWRGSGESRLAPLSGQSTTLVLPTRVFTDSF